MQLPHWLRLRRRARTSCPECGATSDHRTFCDVCGYDLVRQTKDAKQRPPAA